MGCRLQVAMTLQHVEAAPAQTASGHQLLHASTSLSCPAVPGLLKEPQTTLLRLRVWQALAYASPSSWIFFLQPLVLTPCCHVTT